MKGFFAVLVALSLFSFPALACTGSQCAELLERVRLQAGFKIEYYVPHALNARSLYLSPANILYIGTLSSGNGNVYAALDRDNDGVAEEVITIISGLNQPNGIAFRDGDLWVVEMTRIIRFDDIDNLLISTGKAPEPVVIRSDLPTQRSHGWRYASFSPDLTDPYLYIAIGADCNICTVEGIFGTVARFDTRNPTSELEIVAYGVRNSVGFTWHPVTGDLWFTDNGRDNWGDDRPGDELNRVTNFGLHYGYPYCYEKDLVDSQFNTAGNCNAYVPASQVLGPHVAALGNVFYTGSSFPKDYFLNLFIAEHGSWNRAVPLGYRVSLVKMNEQGTAPIEGSDAYTIFAEGWLPDGATTGSQSWGRPVDVKMMKDGSLLVSDDKNNAVYRISYSSGSTEDQESHHNLGLPLIIIGSLLVVFGFIGLIASIALYRAKHCNKCKVHAPKDSMGENLVEKSPQ